MVMACARHILVKTKEEAEALKKQLAGGADFASLAKKYSLCNSAKKGGDLGEFGPGKMLKAFDNVVFKNEEKKYFADIINLKTLLKSKSYIPDIYDMLKDQLEDLMGDEEDEEQRKLYRGE